MGQRATAGSGGQWLPGKHGRGHSDVVGAALGEADALALVAEPDLDLRWAAVGHVSRPISVEYGEAPPDFGEARRGSAGGLATC